MTTEAAVALAWQQVANGVAIGMGYALLAIGITLIFGIFYLLNFAHGEFFMLGAFATYSVMSTLGVPYLAAVVVATAAAAVAGLVCTWTVILPLRGRHSLTVLLATIGVGMVLQNVALLIYGGGPRRIDSPFENVAVQFAGLVLTQQRILTIVAAAVLIFGVFAFLQYTMLGKSLRATAQNPAAAALVGVDLRQMYLVTFALGSALAGLAGGLLGAITFTYPTIGESLIFKGFVVVILGGMGSVPGAVVGALLLGIVESLAAGFVSIQYKDVIGFAVVIAMLILRPTGLWGGIAPRLD